MTVRRDDLNNRVTAQSDTVDGGVAMAVTTEATAGRE